VTGQSLGEVEDELALLGVVHSSESPLRVEGVVVDLPLRCLQAVEESRVAGREGDPLGRTVDLSPDLSEIAGRRMNVELVRWP
jgi:hypothetical protein